MDSRKRKDERQRKDEAAEALARGKLDKAAKLYARLAVAYPRDPQLLIRLGEVERKRGRNEQAASAWLLAGRRFTNAGHALRAIAAYKLVLEVQPDHAEAGELLAALHADRLGQPNPLVTPGRGIPLDATPGPHAFPFVATPAGGTPGPAPFPAAFTPSPGTPGPAPFPAALTPSRGTPGPTAYATPGPASTPPRTTPGPAAAAGADAVPGASIGRIALVRRPAAAPPPSVPVHRFGPPEPEPAPELDARTLGDLLFDVEIEFDELDAPRDRPLPEIPLFSDLAPADFRRLIDRSRHVALRAGEFALREGERADAFYVVVRGGLEVVRDGDGNGPPVRLARLREGAFFGEMALLAGTPRTASVWAAEESELLEFPAGVLRDLVRQHPSVADALRKFYRQRLLANAMATAPIFRPLDAAGRAAIISRFRTRDMAPGEALVAQGQPTEGLFLVLHGSLDVVRTEASGERHLATLREGELFGEQSLLHGGDAGATCRARSRGVVLRLPREEFGPLLDAHPAVRSYVGQLDRERERRNRTGAA